MAEDPKRVKIALIVIRELAEDFVEPYLIMLEDAGIKIREDFLEVGQQSFDEDYGYTVSESYYRLLRTEEEENELRRTVDWLRKQNIRQGDKLLDREADGDGRE